MSTGVFIGTIGTGLARSAHTIRGRRRLRTVCIEGSAKQADGVNGPGGMGLPKELARREFR